MAKVVAQSKDNPVFYVQYAHARAYSVQRNARETFPDLGDLNAVRQKANLALLRDSGELALLKLMALFPRLVEAAAKAHEPHRLAFFLNDFAQAFHGQYTRGNESPYLRYIQPDDRDLTAARLCLVMACAQVIVTGLGILGVQAPQEMR